MRHRCALRPEGEESTLEDSIGVGGGLEKLDADVTPARDFLHLGQNTNAGIIVVQQNGQQS